MKKLIYIAVFLLGFTSYASANPSINIGVSLTGGVFDAAGEEIFSGDHSSNTTSTKVSKKTSAEGDDAETLFGLGSVFVEASINDVVSVGIDYVPHGVDSETTENVQGSDAPGSARVTNTVDVSFDDYRTIYLLLKSEVGAYFKAGYTEIDVTTNEKLNTGGKYGDTTLEGMIFGIGYNHELNDGMFVRAEYNIMDFDDVTLTNTADSTKSIKASDIEGYGARISVGKSF